MIERRKLGVLGYAFRAAFWGWHGLLAYALAHTTGTLLDGPAGEARDIALGINTLATFGLWAAGAVILGGLCMATRGRREFVLERQA